MFDFERKSIFNFYIFRRHSQKSKDITTAENGKAAPAPAPGVTPVPAGEAPPLTEVELRDKKSPSIERDSTTFRDTAYDL